MLIGAALTIAGLAGLAAATTPAFASTPGASRPAMLLPGSARLSSVYCTSSTDCWAVGLVTAQSSAYLNEAFHWNGMKWAKGTIPSPGGRKAGDESDLTAVRCTSSASCWAVGNYFSSTKTGLQTLHWNGKKWGQVVSPAPGSGMGHFSYLQDIACTSASSCWAVGAYGTDTVAGEHSDNLTLHWNGRKWFKVASPDPAGTKLNDVNALEAIRCTSPSDCWAAGSAGVAGPISIQLNEMLHWNGKHWAEANVPSPGGFMNGAYSAISSLSCTSAGDCWAVGSYGGESISSSLSLNAAFHWNGHQWSQVKTPNPDGTGMNAENELNSVSCSAASNCWSVGDLGTISSGGAETGEVLHWKGSKWTLTKAPDPGGTGASDQNDFASVRCVSQKDCWIAGFSRADPDPDLNLFLHWNSKSWSAS